MGMNRAKMGVHSDIRVELFSDYIVFVDESGDHGLKNIDENFPLFCLAFCVVKKDDYVSKIVPSFQQLKFDFWGHDAVILHEHDIRKSKGDFSLLRTNPILRNSFLDQLNQIMNNAEFDLFASVVDKNKHISRYDNPWSPYEIALLFCMERILKHLLDKGEEGKLAHIVFESRGKKEDRELEIEFRRVCANRSNWGYKNLNFSRIRFEPVFASKSINSTGLQMADLGLMLLSALGMLIE